MSHRCNREDCPPSNINGPKTNCIKCKQICYLKCFGLDKGPTVNGMETIKFSLQNDATIFVPVSVCAFSCCASAVSSTELKTNIKLPTTRASSKSRQTQNDSLDNSAILTEFAAVKAALHELNECSTKNQSDLAEIKTVTTKSLEIIKISNDLNRTPRLSTNTARRSSLAQMNNVHGSTRKRRISSSEDSSSAPNAASSKSTVRPTANCGTRDICIGPTVEKKSNIGLRIGEKNEVKQPKFSRAVWISGLHPTVSSDEIKKYILEETDVKSCDKFECFKLVKKDADLSQLKFVSFKIAVGDDFFDYFMSPGIWPKSVSVREFFPKPSEIKLGEFIEHATPHRTKQPRMVTPNSLHTPNIVSQMDQ